RSSRTTARRSRGSSSTSSPSRPSESTGDGEHAMPVDNIWVFGESQDQRPVVVTLELLTKARDLAGGVSVFYAGAEAEGLADEFGKYGASKVYMVDPGDSLPGAATAKAMAGVIESEKPDLIMFPSTYTGRDVCGALSVILDHP